MDPLTLYAICSTRSYRFFSFVMYDENDRWGMYEDIVDFPTEMPALFTATEIEHGNWHSSLANHTRDEVEIVPFHITLGQSVPVGGDLHEYE